MKYSLYRWGGAMSKRIARPTHRWASLFDPMQVGCTRTIGFA